MDLGIGVFGQEGSGNRHSADASVLFQIVRPKGCRPSLDRPAQLSRFLPSGLFGFASHGQLRSVQLEQTLGGGVLGEACVRPPPELVARAS